MDRQGHTSEGLGSDDEIGDMTAASAEQAGIGKSDESVQRGETLASGAGNSEDEESKNSFILEPPPPEDRRSVEMIGADALKPATEGRIDIDRESKLDSSTRDFNAAVSERDIDLALQTQGLELADSQRADELIQLGGGSTFRTIELEQGLDLESKAAREQTNLAEVAERVPKSTELEDDGWSPLHAAVENGDWELVNKLMEKGELLEVAAKDGRKPLLIAAEKGFVKIVELLASSASVESFNEVDHSTALIRACEQEHDAVVKFLIESGANIEAKGKDGCTPLLITVKSRNYNLVKYLLQHGADKRVTLEDGKTAEVLAEDDEGLLKILRQNYLLQGPEIGAKKSDPELRFRYVRAPDEPKSHDKKAACKAVQAEVVQFFIGRREERSQPLVVSVYELIYGKGPDALFNPPAMSPPPGSPIGSRKDRGAKGQPTFTWYHIPANNPTAAMPDDNLRSKLGLNLVKGRGARLKTPSFSYMRPFAKSLKIPFLNYETFTNHIEMTDHLNRINGRNSVNFAIRPNRTHGNLHGLLASRSGLPPMFPPPPPPPPPPFDPRPPISSAAMAPPTTMTLDMNIRGGSGPPSPIPQSRPPKAAHKRTLAWLAGGKSSKSTKKKSRKSGGLVLDRGIGSENPNALLIRGYGLAEENGQVPFQPRRTLDQYFYSHLDNTAHRDRDQVVYRYTKNEEGKIFMVDQMWLWIINGDEEDLLRGPSIEHQKPPSPIYEPLMTAAHGIHGEPSLIFDGVDSIPDIEENDPPIGHRYPRVPPPPKAPRQSRIKRHAADDPMNVHHKVLRHLKETSRPPIDTVYDLAALIATCCASAFDETQIPEDMQFLDFFESSIGSVIEKGTHSLHEFKSGLSFSHNRHEEQDLLGDEPTYDDLNITTEIDLLVEIEDIQDELHILKVVLRDQKRTMRQLDEILLQGRKKPGAVTHEGEEINSMINISCIENHMSRIGEMEKLAEKAHKSLYHLIDLKQKQANFSEAISARMLARETAKNTQLQIKQNDEISKQAEETARQGKTLMVFTVVTIIFLPLSFMAAFFAINIDIFPINEDGKLEFGYILKYMLSISLTLAIPFVLLALRINDVKQAAHGVNRGFRSALVSPRLIPVLGYITLSLIVVVVPSIVWTSKLATTAKVAVTADVNREEIHERD
ncbi:uncharacterized protein J7T55_010465 [Diaporthe amygdali]|uniref:uncharacterized protein n=1 Tax=Phomopsis amygdali TaxID=1214568 RepID=UPI0022FF249A|nr:uncharacterized protein J7T55_010465 [Diaporthe amygdali]KAJ0115642.1 uncharacterized protein J7T55_010465 [Diaporthe amygdali]